ncbi:putative B3 domain-containing protein Os04g0676650 isoform X1 [Miscanthus floridulus]|uniref:putative B3 domain-containing protein Os04g0676650 isoform X1 n=1 Tax=Miscanthus floridulus TaxID=154761 RepID=UPI003457613D
MANAKGSSAGAAGAGHGDLGRAISHEQHQAFMMASVHRAAPGTANVHQQHFHQYPAGLIPAPVAMPVHVPVSQTPYSAQIAVPPPQPLIPPRDHRLHSLPPTGCYQDYSPYGNTASLQHTAARGFADWGAHSNALVSLAHANGSNNINSNGLLHQNLSPYTTHTWTTTYVQRPYNTAYAPATMNMNMLQTPSFHSNNHEKESVFPSTSPCKDSTPVIPNCAVFSNSFNMGPSVTPTSPFQLMSPSSTNYTSTQIFEETNNLEDSSRVFGGGDNESNNSEEPDPTPAVEMEDLIQGNGHINVTNKIVNCQDYRMVLRKDLTNSDVGNIGRIVLPKKDAEPNLPILEDKDGLILEMDDFELPAVWKFKYRYWPNNKSRMYILETTGEFVKRHGLQAKDILIIYRNKKSGRYVARAVKAEHIPAPGCECIKAGNPREECGFSVSPSIKKVIT